MPLSYHVLADAAKRNRESIKISKQSGGSCSNCFHSQDAEEDNKRRCKAKKNKLVNSLAVCEYHNQRIL